MSGETVLINGGGVLALMFLLLAAVVLLIVTLAYRRKSLDYRKYLADMWVAAKIRFLADEDKLDLVKESEDFKLWCKKSRIRSSDYDLSAIVEEELKERVEEPVIKSKK